MNSESVPTAAIVASAVVATVGSVLALVHLWRRRAAVRASSVALMELERLNLQYVSRLPRFGQIKYSFVDHVDSKGKFDRYDLRALTLRELERREAQIQQEVEIRLSATGLLAEYVNRHCELESRLGESRIESVDSGAFNRIEAKMFRRSLQQEIHELEQRIAVLLHDLDPAGIMTSVPGIATVNGAQILARLGDPTRFRSLAGARAFSGLVPSLNASGINGHHGPPTKAGDAPLREALFMAADHARRIDPTLAARYHRLMSETGKHHNSALCHISTALLTRIVACWRAGTPYEIRDLDGTLLTVAQGRAIVTQRYTVSPELRRQRRTTTRTSGSAGEPRSRQALRQPAHPPPKLGTQIGLDSD